MKTEHKKSGKEELSAYKIQPRFELMPERDYQSGAMIIRASLPLGLKGLYDSSKHQITISHNLGSKEEQAVREHESIHARGEYDEAKTDARTASFLGYSKRYFGDPRTWQGLN